MQRVTQGMAFPGSGVVPARSAAHERLTLSPPGSSAWRARSPAKRCQAVGGVARLAPARGLSQGAQVPRAYETHGLSCRRATTTMAWCSTRARDRRRTLRRRDKAAKHHIVSALAR